MVWHHLRKVSLRNGLKVSLNDLLGSFITRYFILLHALHAGDALALLDIPQLQRTAVQQSGRCGASTSVESVWSTFLAVFPNNQRETFPTWGEYYRSA